MNSIKTYKELIVWQKSIQLVKEVYKFTSLFPEEEKFGLIAQLRRAAVSIPSNIAEGWGRLSRKSYILFLRTARGSLYELETQMIIATNLGFSEKNKKLENLLIEISKMLNALIKSLEEKA